jgi:hypothetical protein
MMKEKSLITLAPGVFEADAYQPVEKKVRKILSPSKIS